MDKYIREGGRSFHENKGRYNNPYEIGSTEFDKFERGWSQALKRSPDQLLRDFWAIGKNSIRKISALPALISTKKKNERPEDIYVMLATRAKAKLLNNPSYQPPKYSWSTKVYYVRIEANERQLWKIGITSNDIASRYCIADRKFMVKIRSWQYATREEAEAIEREILAEFTGDVYKGGPVLRSGGDSELLTRDVLELDGLNCILDS